MASIRREITIDARPDEVWAAIRDVGAIHERLAPGFVTDTRMEGDEARIVTFANGLVVRELIVDLDDAARRLAYSARGGRATHHNASFQVFAEGEGTRLLWIADVLPHEVAGPIGDMMDAGCRAMQRALTTAGARG